MNRKPYMVISAAIFGAIAVLHLLRALFAIPVNVGATEFPVGLSWGGGIAAGALSIWGFRLARGEAG
jgi:sorbitol-specific phosphotransferase system component IIBC